MRWVGVIHLPPLPGSPHFTGDIDAIIERAVDEARMMSDAGAWGVLLENFGDRPYRRTRVEPVVTALMAVLVDRVKAVGIDHVGVNLLRNAAVDALAVAVATKATFIRVNVWAGSMITDQGWIQGPAARVLRLRRNWGGDHVQVLADFRVKHARSPVTWSIEDEVDALVHRGGADAIIVTGERTGVPPDLSEVKAVRTILGDVTDLWIGSGMTPENIKNYAAWVDGVIIGSYLREGGRAGAPLVKQRVASWARAVATLS